MFSPADREHMAEALRLAEKGLLTTTPNPRVGCVIVRDGEAVGAGWHEKAGGPHAEILALRAAGTRARGATAYVSLEPCSHHGRTPPCVDALIEAGVARVVAAMQDPNSKVAGSGFASLDGRTALASGQSQWITGPEARRDGHAWRARACAVLTGIGTVRDDDPQMNVREVETPRQPLKVVVDSRLQLPLSAKLLQSGRVLIAAAVEDKAAIAALQDKGAEVVVLPNARGKVELTALMRELGLGANSTRCTSKPATN